MPETLTVRENDDIRIVDVNGDLLSLSAFSLRKELESLICQGSYKLIVNLSKVGYFSTPSVGVLVAISAQVRQEGGYFKVYGLTDMVKRTFDLVGASKVLEIYDSEADAIFSF
jgi:anti-sigma B factor antagonist